MLERMHGCERIMRQQQHKIEVLQKKNATLENQVNRMKNEHKKMDELKKMKLKTEEDFYKEVIDMKYENVMLAE